MNKLDKKDLEILHHLIIDSKQSSYQLSKKTGIPTTTVHNRIKRLESEKIIKSYTIEVDHEKLGNDSVFYVLAAFEMKEMEKAGKNLDDVMVMLKKIPEIEEVAVITGRFGLIFKIRLDSIKKLYDVVLVKARKIPGLGHTESMYAMHYCNFKKT